MRPSPREVVEDHVCPNACGVVLAVSCLAQLQPGAPLALPIFVAIRSRDGIVSLLRPIARSAIRRAERNRRKVMAFPRPYRMAFVAIVSLPSYDVEVQSQRVLQRRTNFSG